MEFESRNGRIDPQRREERDMDNCFRTRGSMEGCCYRESVSAWRKGRCETRSTMAIREGAMPESGTDASRGYSAVHKRLRPVR